MSKLLLCKQTHHPVTVQNRDHVYPAATATSTTMADELLICVSELRYLTNEAPNYLKENTQQSVADILGCLLFCLLR